MNKETELCIGIKEIELLKLFENHSHLSLKEISFFLEVNSTSVKKHINNLNSFLEKKKIGKINNNNKNFILKYENFSKAYTCQNLNINYDPKERFYFIIVLLVFEKQIKISSLVSKLNVSFNTLLGDLNKIKLFLKNFNLTISSTPFLGVCLDGPKNLKNNFSINAILKYLLEKEFNPQTFNLFGIYINPLLYSYLEKKKDTIDMELIEKITQKLIEIVKIDSDIYLYNTLKSTLIYFSVKKTETMPLNEFNFKGEKKIIYLKIIQILDIKNNPHLHSAIFILVKIISRKSLNYPYSFMKKDRIFKVLLEKFKKKYNLSLSSEEKKILFNMVKNIEYKYLFNLKIYDNNYIVNSDIPKFILNGLENTLKEKKIKILKEDTFVIALYIYHVVCNHYLDNKFNKKILVCDYSNSNWIGKGFINEVKKYLPYIEIDLTSICLLKFENINFDNYDYIIFMNKFGKNEYIPKGSFDEKFIFIRYNNHFDINSFWGRLIFKNKN